MQRAALSPSTPSHSVSPCNIWRQGPPWTVADAAEQSQRRVKLQGASPNSPSPSQNFSVGGHWARVSAWQHGSIAALQRGSVAARPHRANGESPEPRPQKTGAPGCEAATPAVAAALQSSHETAHQFLGRIRAAQQLQSHQLATRPSAQSFAIYCSSASVCVLPYRLSATFKWCCVGCIGSVPAQIGIPCALRSLARSGPSVRGATRLC